MSRTPQEELDQEGLVARVRNLHGGASGILQIIAKEHEALPPWLQNIISQESIADALSGLEHARELCETVEKNPSSAKRIAER